VQLLPLHMVDSGHVTGQHVCKDSKVNSFVA